jgi:parvulin-like peptidyl-prolyl isomerase
MPSAHKPPEAERPIVRTEAELAAERQRRIDAGEIVPAGSPAIATPAGESKSRTAPRAPIKPTPGAIEADILIVNTTALTVSEVLYPIRDEISEARREQTPAGFSDRVRRLVREEAQRQVGAILICAEASALLSEQQKKIVEDAVKRVVDERVARDFGGSAARFSAHLSEFGLTLDQYKAQVERDLVARQYMREKLMPQLSFRRDELLSEYRQNIEKYSTPETRELFLIEVAFAKCLPDGQTWERAEAAARAQARLKAVRRIREAHGALATRPFEEVAREYSTGAQASAGGAWGKVGKPLQPPLDQVSKPVFTFREGQYSEPIETATGWYVSRCGRIEPATTRSFVQVQEEIRKRLMDQRFTRLSIEYYLKLAERATFTSFDAFVQAAVRRAASSEWRVASSG